MNLTEHANYKRLVETARASHQAGRSVSAITQIDIELARLYSYAFRTQTIGAFHATRQALLVSNEPSTANNHSGRAVVTLEDLANIAIDPVPSDARALISTFYRYDTLSRRVLSDLDRALERSSDVEMAGIRHHFASAIQSIMRCSGICLNSDAKTIQQASYVVPNLGITIVPLAYGDHHSWNIARLSPQHPDVPRHLHQQGVEIHLGYSPVQGYMVLGDHRAKVESGYALAIPPETPHGYINASTDVHHVPFIFGSLKLGGWGVFLDVEAMPCGLSDLQETARTHSKMNTAVRLEDEIDSAKQSTREQRRIIVPSHRTFASGIGGIELAATRVTPKEFSFAIDSYRIVSVVNGTGNLTMAGMGQDIRPHDHFGVPAHMNGRIRQLGDDPLVLLDAVLRDKR